MKIHATITDFPVFSRLETSFAEYQKAGVEGVEIVLGIKSRTRIKDMAKLSKKYHLPITSIHQPPWSFLGMYLDESFIAYAKELGTKYVVVHPLSFHSFESTRMKRYFEKLAKAQSTYKTTVLIENMSPDFFSKKLHNGEKNTMIDHLRKLHKIADTYGFLLNFDTSHAEFTNPPKEKIFSDIFSKIGNIHLSSFTTHKHHLPLNMGDFQIKEFITYLSKEKYKGMVTLEVYYPRWTLLPNGEQIKAISDSVKVFKKIIGK